MRWRWFKRSHPTPVTATVPDTASVRQAALAASWRRDRRVAMRRLWWRWALWALPRYVAPAAVLMTATLLTWMHVRAPSESVAAMAPSPVVQPPVPAPSPTLIAEHATVLDTTLPLNLRLERERAPQRLAAAAFITDPAPITPTLKPENWLHSKEP